jgi:hypothetical protein
MKAIRLLPLSLLIGLAGGPAVAQDVSDLIRVDAGNRSASPAVTRSIAAYIAGRNSATVVQVMAQPRPEAAPPMTVEALLAAIESNARIVAPPQAAPAPAAVTTPPPQPAAPQKTTAKQGGGSGGGKSGGGGAGGGGGGGW